MSPAEKTQHAFQSPVLTIQVSIHVRHCDRQFSIDDSDHVNVRKHNVSIQIVSHVAQMLYKVLTISMMYIDWDHVIYRQRNVTLNKLFHPRGDDLFLRQLWFVLKHWVFLISKSNIRSNFKKNIQQKFSRTSPIRCRKSDKIWKCSGFTVIKTRHTSQPSSKYDICACRQPLDKKKIFMI